MDITTNQTVIGFFVAIVGPLIGIFLGHILSKRWDLKKEKRNENKIRRMVKNSLKKELSKVKENIIEYENTMKNIPDISFPIGCYESSISSGNLSLIEEELQLLVSTTYGKINRLKSRQYQIQDLRFRVLQDGEYNLIFDDFTDELAELKRYIDKVITRIDRSR